MFAKAKDLPKKRFVIKEKSFSKTGIHYSEPIYVKTSKRTWSAQGNSKRYGVLFTRLTTHAKHFEVAADLSTY